MKVCFVTQSGYVACMGGFLYFTKDEFKSYVKRFPIHWVEL